MSNDDGRRDDGKPYDLEERTCLFAKDIRAFVKRLPNGICNQEDVRQLARSSGSVGASYIEANEALSKKDFLMRMRISRKEARESHVPAAPRHWRRSKSLRNKREVGA